jgi:hypothetical protein
MKALITFLFAAATLSAFSQGALVVDQQSANRSDLHGNTLMSGIGQSFTPALSSIGFIQLAVFDANSPPNGAEVFVNLRQGSMSGAIIGVTAAVEPPNSTNVMPGFFSTFYFPSPISVTPGTTYFFEPLDQVGTDTVDIGIGSFNYPGGTMYSSGAPSSMFDVWFTEGVVVPEPGTLALLGIGSVLMLWQMWRARRRRRGIAGSV